MENTKPWWQSKGVWGSTIAMLAGLATLAGVKLDATLQDQLSTLLAAAGELVGGALAFYGRVTAKATLQ